MADQAYSGPERRRFRRLELHYPVHLRSVEMRDGRPAMVTEGVTVNLSYGGALVGLSSASGLQGATPVTVRFVDRGRVLPDAMAGVVWRPGRREEDDEVAVEFDAPLLAYDGAVELADRLEWLRRMGGEEFLRTQVEAFLDATPDILRRIRDRQHEGDLPALAQLVRSLKTNAGNVGAVNLYEVARRAERAAEEGDAGASKRHVDALQEYFDAIRPALEAAC